MGKHDHGEDGSQVEVIMPDGFGSSFSTQQIRAKVFCEFLVSHARDYPIFFRNRLFSTRNLGKIYVLSTEWNKRVGRTEFDNLLSTSTKRLRSVPVNSKSELGHCFVNQSMVSDFIALPFMNHCITLHCFYY